jgi:PPOX class probable F420-dependent enzyme
MPTLSDPEIKQLLADPNYAVVSTLQEDGSILSTIVWDSADDDALYVNSAVGRRWPTNLQRDPRVTVLVQEAGNPYHFVSIRGTATATTDGADEHIDALTKKYIGEDKYPFRQPGEQRIKFAITPTHISYVKR